jgi:CheY-like chemotaxis protein
MDQKILVVDDSKTVCQATKFAFTVSPYSVDVAHSAADALRMLRASQYAGAIIDYVLPDQSGVDLLRAIRQDQALRALPVVILHGSFHPFDPAEATSAGADALLVKPFLTDEILGEVSNAIAAAPNRPEPGSRPAIAPPAPEPVDNDDVSDDFDIITENDSPSDYMTPPPRAGAAPPPAPMAGTFRRVGPSPTPAPLGDAPPSPRRPPLAPPPPSPLRGGLPQPPPPARMPASARTAVQTTETSVTEPADVQTTPPMQTDEIRTTRQVDAVTGAGERLISEQASSTQPAITEPVAASGSLPVADDSVPPAASDESSAEIRVVTSDQPDSASPAAPAANASAPVTADPELVKALVRELLPGIVKEFLSSMLRQTGQKLEQYSQARIDAFAAQEMPALASQRLATYVEEELPGMARKAIDEALAGIVGEE